MHGKDRKEVYFKIDVTAPWELGEKHHEIREERQTKEDYRYTAAAFG